jgi:hypothetical protein
MEALHEIQSRQHEIQGYRAEGMYGIITLFCRCGWASEPSWDRERLKTQFQEHRERMTEKAA